MLHNPTLREASARLIRAGQACVPLESAWLLRNAGARSLAEEGHQYADQHGQLAPLEQRVMVFVDLQG